MKGALGKKINRAKTALFFSKLTAYEMHLTIKEALEVPVVQQYEKLIVPHLLVRRRRTVLQISNIGFGKNCKDVKQSS